ncbi:hypothetical protein JCM8097_005103 [Rhodosporidiobolus ruineniae]
MLLILAHVAAFPTARDTHRTLVACCFVSRRMRALALAPLVSRSWSYDVRFEVVRAPHGGRFSQPDLERLDRLPTEPSGRSRRFRFSDRQQVCARNIASVEIVCHDDGLRWSRLDLRSRRAWRRFLQKQTRPFRLSLPSVPETRWLAEGIFRQCRSLVEDLTVQHLDGGAFLRLGCLARLSSLTVTSSVEPSPSWSVPQRLRALSSVCFLRPLPRPVLVSLYPHLRTLTSLTLLFSPSLLHHPVNLNLGKLSRLTHLILRLQDLPCGAVPGSWWLKQHFTALATLLSASVPAGGAAHKALDVLLVPHAPEQVPIWRTALRASRVMDQLGRDSSAARVRSVSVVAAVPVV